MTATDADATQDKKDEKWPDRVALRRWDSQGKQFLPEIKDVHARYKELGRTDKKTAWELRNANLPTPTVGSEITDKDGVVWVVTKLSRGDEETLCYAEKKDARKKED